MLDPLDSKSTVKAIIPHQRHRARLLSVRARAPARDRGATSLTLGLRRAILVPCSRGKMCQDDGHETCSTPGPFGVSPMRKLPSIAAILALVLTATVTQAQPPEKDDGRFFFFKDGDTIVVMGDSITEQHLYSNYLEMWSVCRFPKRNLTFRNVGIGGDRSPGGNNRFKRDVLAHKATVLTVDFGMNDGNYKPFDDKTFQVYMKGLQGIADQA